MKRIVFLAVLASVATAGCASPAANTTAENKTAASGSQVQNTNKEANEQENKPAAAEDKDVPVFDGRKIDLPNKEGSKEEQELVKTEVKKHDAEIREKVPFDACDKDSEASIVDIAEGSFTKANAKQKAYLYELCMPGRTFGIGGVIVVEDGKAVTHYAYGENGLSSNLYSLPDVNKNGFSELFFYGGSMNQGYAGGSIELFELKDDKLEFLGRTTTYSSGTGAKEDGSTTAYYISVRPGTAPAFSRDTYEQKGESQKWEQKKKAESFELDKKEPAKIVKIN